MAGVVDDEVASVVGRAKLWAAMHAHECEYWAPDDPQLLERAQSEPREYHVAPGRPYFRITETLKSMQEPKAGRHEAKWIAVHEWMYGRPWGT